MSEVALSLKWRTVFLHSTEMEREVEQIKTRNGDHRENSAKKAGRHGRRERDKLVFGVRNLPKGCPCGPRLPARSAIWRVVLVLNSTL